MWHQKQSGTEAAVKHTYNPSTGSWTTSNISVSMSSRPFQEGTMRRVFDLTDFSLPADRQQCVAKLSKNPCEPQRTYFADVEMQYKCKDLAKKYNALSPPKKIDFLDSWVVEFPNRFAAGGGTMMAMVEPKLRGHYTKHSNNFGFVSPEERNTPQAFSHWTWVASSGTLLVCDIQGVNDLYTDPQIHSNAGHENFLYGKGDMGIEGIQKFFSTHRCNALCRSLHLPATPNVQAQAARRPFETAVHDCFGHHPMYSPSLSPASSVGGLSIGSAGFGRGSPFSMMPDYGMQFPALPMPLFC